MTDHTIKAAMKVKGGAGVGRVKEGRGELIKRIADASRQARQVPCVDDHEAFAVRLLAALDAMVPRDVDESVKSNLRYGPPPEPGGVVNVPGALVDPPAAPESKRDYTDWGKDESTGSADLSEQERAFREKAGEATWPGKHEDDPEK